MSSNPESEPTLNDTVTAAVVWTTKIRCKAMKIAPNTNAPFMTLTVAKTGEDGPESADDGLSNKNSTKYAVLGAGEATTFAEGTEDSASETTFTVTSTTTMPTTVTSTNTGNLTGTVPNFTCQLH
jgi:hypothetical protein